jgi:hypothetical protein
MQEESTARMLVICVVHLSVCCKMPLAGVRECNVEERIMNIVRSVTRTWSIFCCIQYWSVTSNVVVGCMHENIIFLFHFPTSEESLGVFPIGRIRLGSEKACCSSTCVYRNLPCTFYSIKLYCIFFELHYFFIYLPIPSRHQNNVYFCPVAS